EQVISERALTCEAKVICQAGKAPRCTAPLASSLEMELLDEGKELDAVYSADLEIDETHIRVSVAEKTGSLGRATKETGIVLLAAGKQALAKRMTVPFEALELPEAAAPAD